MTEQHNKPLDPVWDPEVITTSQNMKIDERLLAYKPISVTLNFDWENTTLDERAQMRWNYIQEQKKKYPNYVGYDFPEHFSSLFGGSKVSTEVVDFSILVNTLGQLIRTRIKTVESSFGHNNGKGYRNFSIREKNKNRERKAHRVIACTFIPIPKELLRNKLHLVVNHKNDIKHSNLISNLEWCTQKVNTDKAIRTSAVKTKSCKMTIKLPGRFYDRVYYFFSKRDLVKHGIVDHVVFGTPGKSGLYLHSLWEEIDKDEIKNKPIGISKEVIEFLKNPIFGKTGSKGVVGTIVTEGPCKGERFVIYGFKQIGLNGFGRSQIEYAINKTGRIYKSCTWERVTREEAAEIPIGLTEAQKEHIFG